jgi:type II secretory pathway pseudopilin PulG
MPTGERGYTYLGLLALLALLGAGLATLGTAWSQAAQRERERELQFRGQQIRNAIAAYWAAHEPAELPPSLQALLVDGRGGAPRHHLRRLYADPFTGQADWALLHGPQGRGIAGVRSRADTRRLQLGGATAARPAQPRVSDWIFVYTPPVPAEATAARPEEETR